MIDFIFEFHFGGDGCGADGDACFAVVASDVVDKLLLEADDFAGDAALIRLHMKIRYLRIHNQRRHLVNFRSNIRTTQIKRKDQLEIALPQVLRLHVAVIIHLQ